MDIINEQDAFTLNRARIRGKGLTDILQPLVSLEIRLRSRPAPSAQRLRAARFLQVPGHAYG